jgi:ribosome-associated translation inhibitor RaiA
MRVQIYTDGNIGGHEKMTDQVRSSVDSALKRMSDHIMRVEVHLSDVNGRKRGVNDMRCMIEARLEGRRPIAVTHRASTLDQAVDCALDKLSRLIESKDGRMHHQKSRRTDPPPPEPNLM